MADTQIVLAGLPSLLSVYNSAPWLIDGAIYCLFLGLLFRTMFEKAKIAKDDDASKKLGGIVGFLAGASIAIYLQTRGWYLITDGGIWIVGIVLALIIFFLWTTIDNSLNGEHRHITLPAAAAVVLFIVWMLMAYGSTSINQGLKAIPLLGSNAPMWISLVLFALLIFGLFFAMKGALGAKSSETTTTPSGPGLWRRIFGEPAEKPPLEGRQKGFLTADRPWYAPWRRKPSVPSKRGLWGALTADRPWYAPWKRKRPAKPIEPKEIETIDTTTDTEIGNATTAIEDSANELAKIIAISGTLKQVLNATKTASTEMQGNIPNAAPDTYPSYNEKIKEFTDKIKEARQNFDANQLLNKHTAATEANQRAINSTKKLLATGLGKGGALEQIKALNEEIKKITTHPDYAKLNQQGTDIETHMSNNLAWIKKLTEELENTLKGISSATQISQAKDLVKQINENSNSVRSVLLAQGKRIADLAKASEAEKPQALGQITTVFSNINGIIDSTLLLIETFEGPRTYEKLKQELLQMNTAIGTFRTKKKHHVDEYEKMLRQLKDLQTIVGSIRQKQIEEEQDLMKLEDIKTAMEAERTSLNNVILSGNALLTDLKSMFNRPLATEELKPVQEELPEEEKASGKVQKEFKKDAKTSEEIEADDQRDSIRRISDKKKKLNKFLYSKLTLKQKKERFRKRILPGSFESNSK